MSESRPNILFAITDDWSFGHAGAYGCAWVQTPTFDRLAGNGLLFDRSYTPNAKCAPSRACILTGRNSWQLQEACNHNGFFPPEFKVFPEALADAGYFVGATNKGWSPGVSLHRDGSPRALVGRQYDRRQCLPPVASFSRNDYSANFADFLDDAAAGAPWCFWFGAAEPHRPYVFGSGSLTGKTVDLIDRVPGYWPDTPVVRQDMLDYACAVEYFDRKLGEMIALLEQRGELENTLVIVTSDHGMPFPRAKGQAYGFGNHLSLAMHWPLGIKSPGRRIDEFVSHIDLAPTIVASAGLDWNSTGLAPSPGRALQNIFISQTAGANQRGRDHVLVGQERHDVGRPHDEGYPIRGIVTRTWLFLENFRPERWPACDPETGYLNCDGSPTKTIILQLRHDAAQRKYWDWSFGKRGSQELYNLEADPDCLDNLAERPEYNDRLEMLRAQMHAELKAEEDPRLQGEGDVFDRYLVWRPEMRQFYRKSREGCAPHADWVNASDFEPDFRDPPSTNF